MSKYTTMHQEIWNPFGNPEPLDKTGIPLKTQNQSAKEYEKRKENNKKRESCTYMYLTDK